MNTTSYNTDLPIPSNATVIHLKTKGGRIPKTAFRSALSFRRNRLIEQVRKMQQLKTENQAIYPNILEKYMKWC